MEFNKFKKFNYVNSLKKFCNHFHCIRLYYRHTHYVFYVFRVYVIHSNCAKLYTAQFLFLYYGL